MGDENLTELMLTFCGLRFSGFILLKDKRPLKELLINPTLKRSEVGTIEPVNFWPEVKSEPLGKV